MTYTAGVLDAAHNTVLTSFQVLQGRLRAWHVGATPATTAWTGANDAWAIPFLLAVPTTFVGAFFVSGTAPGTANYDIGIYRDDFTRVTSLGATASVNTTGAILPVGGGSFAAPVTLPRGRYYMAMSAAATTITVLAHVQGNQVLRAFGMFKMTTAQPLPTTFVPASMGATAFCPLIGLTTVAGAVL